MNLLGFDIGGTKCAVISASHIDGNIKLLEKKKSQPIYQLVLRK